MTFKNLNLNEKLLSQLDQLKYETPTPIQEQAIPIARESKDILAVAQTGTGKTAAFCLPIVDKIFTEKIQCKSRSPKFLILTPTRELAVQIFENLKLYGKGSDQRYSVVFGGVSQVRQTKELNRGVHVLVATPGRLLDLVQQRCLYLDQIQCLVLDEADRMLDMGFSKDIEKITQLIPKTRHTLLFSATMPKAIESLARELLRDPKKIEISPESTTVELIQQSAYYVDKPNKIKLLTDLLIGPRSMKTLVFVEMKHMANKVTEKLIDAGIKAVAIHGNKSQGARQKALNDFTDNKVQVLVATDIASRGIDVKGITHVINYDLPNLPESYVHRIGRTARAGEQGIAISLVNGLEKSFLYAIEKATRQKIEIKRDHAYHSHEAENTPTMSAGKAKAKLESERKSRGGPPNKFRRKFKPRSGGGGGKGGSGSSDGRGGRGGPKSKSASGNSKKSSSRPRPGGASAKSRSGGGGGHRRPSSAKKG